MPECHGRQTVRFTLSDMLAGTFVIAVALAAWIYAQDWRTVVLAVIAGALTVGLSRQARDIWVAGSTADHSHAVHLSLWFPLGWRVLAGPLLIVVILLGCVPQAALDEEFAWDADTIQRVGDHLSQSVPVLLMTTALLGGYLARRSPSPARATSRWTEAAWWLGAVVMLVVVGTSMLLVYSLVHIAIQGIFSYFPFSRLGVAQNPPTATNREVAAFVRWSYLAGFGVLLSAWLTVRLAASFERHWIRRIVIAAILLVTLTLTCRYLIWVYQTELPRISPIFSELLFVRPQRQWLYAVVLVGIFATAATWRIMQQPAQATCRLPINWQERSSRYWHERALVLGLVAFVVLDGWVRDAFFPDWWPTVLWDRFLSVVYAAFGEPVAYLRLACLIVIGLVAVRRWRGEGATSDTLFAVLPPARFALVWLAVVATIVTGVPAFTVFCFAFWLAPP